MHRLLGGLFLIVTMLFGSPALAQSGKPTIVLVHGALSGSSTWDGVIRILEESGYTVIAAANPLRTLKGDAQYLASLLSSIKTPIVLVGHSYGGSVISEAANGIAGVKALVYVTALAPEAGETADGLSNKFPGSTLASTLAPPVLLHGGGQDLYVVQDKYHEQFAADLPAAQARLLAATQRPVTQEALAEPSTEPAWKTIPSWFVYGDADKNISPAANAFMAERAKSRLTVVVKGASHLVMISHPDVVAKLIETAATAK